MSVDKYQMRHVNGTSHENLDIAIVGAGLVSISTKNSHLKRAQVLTVEKKMLIIARDEFFITNLKAHFIHE